MPKRFCYAVNLEQLLCTEWDSEIEEFLPAVTEDNLQVLTRAGESGDQSPTPTSMLSDAQNGIIHNRILFEKRAVYLYEISRETETCFRYRIF